MPSMYCKLFASLYQGTLRGRAHEILVFTNLLAHCDSTGTVDKHPRAIAEEVGLTVDEVKAALVTLESPDEESRSPELGGARISRIDAHRSWGWLVVNHAKYSAIRNAEDRKEQNRASQQRWRERNGISKVSQRNPESANADEEADKDAEADQSMSLRLEGGDTANAPQKKKPSSKLPTTDTAIRIAGLKKRRLTTEWSDKEIKAFKSIGVIPEEDMAVMEAYYASDCEYLRRDMLTLLNNWQGEVDRAHAFAAETRKPQHRALVESVDPDGWREFLAAHNQPYAAFQHAKSHLKDRFREGNK